MTSVSGPKVGCRSARRTDRARLSRFAGLGVVLVVVVGGALLRWHDAYPKADRQRDDLETREVQERAQSGQGAQTLELAEAASLGEPQPPSRLQVRYAVEILAIERDIDELQSLLEQSTTADPGAPRPPEEAKAEELVSRLEQHAKMIRQTIDDSEISMTRAHRRNLSIVLRRIDKGLPELRAEVVIAMSTASGTHTRSEAQAGALGTLRWMQSRAQDLRMIARHFAPTDVDDKGLHK